MGLLSLAIWIPILFGVALLGMRSTQQAGVVRWTALIGALAGFLVTAALPIQFDESTASMQFVEHFAWIERYNIHYFLGIDGISLWFLPLTGFITVLVVIAGWEATTQRLHQYMGSFLILSGLMIGVFSALDGMLFYVFFEATLIPMYLIIGIWGGPNRIYAAFKFFLYTLLGSLLLLLALLSLYNLSNGSFDVLLWHALPIDRSTQSLLFIGLLVAFAVKVPMWPVHTWLPDVHVEAPTGGSAVLAAIMLKLGAYGFLRFSLPIAPDASQEWAGWMIGLSLVAVVYVGLVTLVQADMKKLVAYSSVAHMGFVTLGFFLFTALGVSGGIVQMISHGLVSAAMFLAIGVLYERVHSREIADYGGVVHAMPRFTALALLFFLANCGLPGTAGFVGEWMVILATVQFDFWLGMLAASALFFGAAYSLWMFKRVYLGPVGNDHVAAMPDIRVREWLVLTTLAISILVLGLYPKPFTDAMAVSVDKLVAHVATSKLPQLP